MKIGVIGAGRIGANAARLFARVGHEVVISNSRGPETLSGIVEEIGDNTRAATIEEAADFGDVVFEAIPFGRYEELPADRLADKVVIDASNYYPQRDGELELHGLTSTEAVARHLDGARVVKAFNTMYYERLANEGRPGLPVEERLVLFVAGEDDEAKGIVSRLIEEIGFAPVDTGSLKDSYRQEPGSPVYNIPMTPERARETLAGNLEEVMMSETAAGCTPRDYISFLRSLRAVRSFRPDAVSRELVDDILEVARWSGSAGNKQPWEIVVVRDRETLRSLASVEGYAGHLAGATLGMVLVMAGERRERETYDEARFAERIMLAAHAHGVGSSIGWIVGSGRDAARELLGIPQEKMVRTVISLGYPEARRSGRGQARKSLDEIVHKERYG